ncbi:hypothetical protein [Phyllobacterium sp. K27]
MNIFFRTGRSRSVAPSRFWLHAATFLTLAVLLAAAVSLRLHLHLL